MALDTGSGLAEAETRGMLGLVHRARGDLDAALDEHRRSVDLLRDTGARHVVPTMLNWYGDTLRACGRRDEALVIYREALACATRVGEGPEAGIALDGIAHLRHDGGDLSGARAHWEQALARYPDGDLPETVRIRASLAALDRAAASAGPPVGAKPARQELGPAGPVHQSEDQ
jgi:tetratricopeptide (TPR) repeat protein